MYWLTALETVSLKRYYLTETSLTDKWREREKKNLSWKVSDIEEGLNWKTRQRSSRRIGGQNLCCASCFASAFLKQTVELHRPPCPASCFAWVFLKQMVEFNHLFQKDQGKTASMPRILSSNPTRRPLPCLLIQFFFYGFQACKSCHFWI